jgi:hypothetical protein
VRAAARAEGPAGSARVAIVSFSLFPARGKVLRFFPVGSVARAEFHCPGVDDSHGTQTCGLDGQFTGDTPILCSSPTSCREAKEIDSSAETGVYTITRADGSSEEEMYCDMETDGGGWTLTFLLRHVNNMGEPY